MSDPLPDPLPPGDPAHEQLTRLWTAALPAVSAYVHSLIPNWQQAEDVLQDAAVVVLRRFPEYDPTASFQGWVFGIVRRIALDSRRKVAVARIRFDADVVDLLAVSAAADVDHLAETRQALHACLQDVEGRAREALRLRYVDGLDYAEVATRLQLSGVAARKLVSRLHARLRSCIEARLGISS